ncbi:MAG: alpha/beta-hydrolase N-terminal domain-containing protein, partial [Ilumatobacteraceae bacterium]
MAATLDDPTLIDGATMPDDEPAGVDERPPPGRRHTILGRPRFAGTVGALLFLWASFWPTLMPRSFVTQGAMSGISVAIGYAVFTLLGWLVGLVLARFGVSIGPAARRVAWIVLGVFAAIVIVVGGLWMCGRWQNQQRSMLLMDELGWWFGIPMLIVAAIVTVILGVIGRLVGRGVVHLHRLLSRALSPSLAAFATVILVAFIAMFLFNDVVADGFRDWANSAFGTAEGIEQPASPLVSGSPDSLVPWDSLGVQGRTWVDTATPTAMIADFQSSIGNPDADVLEPIRVFTGIKSADDVQDRADLAVEELQRTGAFDRDILAVVTVTGTGWIDPDASRALEVLHSGNTAMVGMQYSFLPSWI